MNKEMSDKEAYLKSVKKWERIIAGEGSDGGRLDCGFCMKWHSRVPGSCAGCPLSDNGMYCVSKDSPYEKWCSAESNAVYSSPELDLQQGETINFLRKAGVEEKYLREMTKKAKKMLKAIKKSWSKREKGNEK